MICNEIYWYSLCFRQHTKENTLAAVPISNNTCKAELMTVYWQNKADRFGANEIFYQMHTVPCYHIHMQPASKLTASKPYKGSDLYLYEYIVHVSNSSILPTNSLIIKIHSVRAIIELMTAQSKHHQLALKSLSNAILRPRCSYCVIKGWQCNQ